MKRIALKIDVDTCRGTLVGVPALIDCCSGTQLRPASFSHSVRTAAVGSARASPSRYYDLRHASTGCSCRRRISASAAPTACGRRSAAGFEVAVHAWNRVRWERRVLTADNAWVEAEMAQACRRFEAVFGEPPQAHGAAGWRMNRHALRLTQRLGFAYASDCRGKFPFIPVIDGELVHCPQLPTTLPTLDELLLPARSRWIRRSSGHRRVEPIAATTSSPCAPSWRG
jgi:undecaprenyl phosphate-alpha-L-ara4FN deformylase